MQEIGYYLYQKGFEYLAVNSQLKNLSFVCMPKIPKKSYSINGTSQR